MTKQLLVAGGGMGGLASAITASRAGWQAHVFEQAAVLSEAGAGLQLGPNATRRLQAWGLGAALERDGALPAWLRVRSASSGRELATMRLRERFVERYGAPYITLHRADLQGLLREQAESLGVQLKLGEKVSSVSQTAHAVSIDTGISGRVEGAMLVGADGLWSQVKTQLWPASPAPRPTGHLAYRSLLPQQELPGPLRSGDVTVWLGPRLHAVTYPVRRGEWLNAVVIVQGERPGRAQDWDQPGTAAELLQAMDAARVCPSLKDVVLAAPAWRLWVLHERAPVDNPREMASGRVALVGDAAHPMRPYFAQGAGMAIEDADELGRCLSAAGGDANGVPAALARYAAARWQRNARVQRRSARNGRIFHATGPIRWSRDLALKLLGERLLDAAWLYR
jgi:salicylate hydroxylase